LRARCKHVSRSKFYAENIAAFNKPILRSTLIEFPRNIFLSNPPGIFFSTGVTEHWHIARVLAFCIAAVRASGSIVLQQCIGEDQIVAVQRQYVDGIGALADEQCPLPVQI
jgi:hypothetical protein